jgi:hypothetical protein
MASKRDNLVKQFVSKAKQSGRRRVGNGGYDNPFGGLGSLTPGQRVQRGHRDRPAEDDPGWNPKTMGNRRGR